MTDVFRLSATEFYMAAGQTVITGEMRQIRLGAGTTTIPIYFGRTFDPHPVDSAVKWRVEASFGVSGLGWSRRQIVEIDRTPLDTRI